MAAGKKQKGKTYTELLSEMFAFASILSPEDFTSVILSCQKYIDGEDIPELGEQASVAFAFFKTKLDAEIRHNEDISSKRKVAVSCRKDRNNRDDSTKVTKLQNVQNVQIVDFVDGEKESIPSPDGPSLSSPTPSPISPPIIPQPLKEKEDLSHGNAAPEKKSRKSQDHYGSLSVFQRDRFDKFYLAYPKKSTKQECAAWWDENKPDDEMLSAILKGLEAYKKSREVLNNYTLDPIRFLKRRRWEDEFETAQQPLFSGNVVPVEKNPRGYDPSNGFSEEELERRKERSRQLAKERGEL